MTTVLLPLLIVLQLTVPTAQADEVDDAITALEKAIKEKSKPDVKHYLGLLADKFATAKHEQQEKIVKLDGSALNMADQEIKEAAVEAVSRTNASGVPLLVKEIDKKSTEENAAYMAAVVKALGRLKDPKAGLEKLTKLLKNKSIDVVTVATESLANYKDAPFETKKAIFDDILKIYSSVGSAANSPRDTTAKAKLAKLQPAADETLRNLTGQQFKSHTEWLKWWNDTGKKAAKW